MERDYREHSARPLTCFCFIAPLLLVYEFGMVIWGPTAMRNGADLWLRQLLASIGFGQYFLLPLLTCGILLGWHHACRHPWSVRRDVLARMACDSILFAVSMIVLARLYFAWFPTITPTSPSVTAAITEEGRLPYLLSFLGAGIYEEFMFRLLLLTIAMAGCRSCGADPLSSAVWGVVATSLFFSAAHYQEFFGAGEIFQWGSFGFRFMAGTFFSILYLCRGFGVAVGAHVVYDVLVSLAT